MHAVCTSGELLSDVTCIHELTSEDSVMLVVTQPATPPSHAPNTEEEMDPSEHTQENELSSRGEVHENTIPEEQNDKEEVAGLEVRDGEQLGEELLDMVADAKTVAGEKGEVKVKGVKSVRLLSTDVDQGNGNMKEVLVKIYDCSIGKPFLGGYRRKVLQQEYHNASAQTHTKPRQHDKVRDIASESCDRL